MMHLASLPTFASIEYLASLQRLSTLPTYTKLSCILVSRSSFPVFSSSVQLQLLISSQPGSLGYCAQFFPPVSFLFSPVSSFLSFLFSAQVTVPHYNNANPELQLGNWCKLFCCVSELVVVGSSALLQICS